MDNEDNFENPDDFDPNDDSPTQWINKAIEIFGESGDDWREKLNQLADMHPMAITRLKIGVKDWGMILTKEKLLELDRLEKRSRKR